MWGGMHMSACVHGRQSQILLSSSTTLYLILEVESYRIWSSCLWLDWLASNQFQGSTPLCLPNPRITDAHHHTHLFRGGRGLRIWTWSCRLAWKAFYQMSHLFGPLIMALPHIHVLVSFLISSPHHFLSLDPLSMVPFLPFLAPKSSHFCFHNRHFSLLFSSLLLTSGKTLHPLSWSSTLLSCTNTHKHTTHKQPRVHN